MIGSGDASRDYWTKTYHGLHLAKAGITLDQFLGNPMAALREISKAPNHKQWLREYRLSVSNIVHFATGSPLHIERNPSIAGAGIEEHKRHHEQATRYHSSVITLFPKRDHSVSGGGRAVDPNHNRDDGTTTADALGGGSGNGREADPDDILDLLRAGLEGLGGGKGGGQVDE